MPSNEEYKLLCKRIAQLAGMLAREKSKPCELPPRELKQLEARITNLEELLDTNLRAFAMVMNRNFDSKLDFDPEIN